MFIFIRSYLFFRAFCYRHNIPATLKICLKKFHKFFNRNYAFFFLISARWYKIIFFNLNYLFNWTFWSFSPNQNTIRVHVFPVPITRNHQPPCLITPLLACTDYIARLCTRFWSIDVSSRIVRLIVKCSGKRLMEFNWACIPSTT